MSTILRGLLKSGLVRRIVNPRFGRVTSISNGAVCLVLSQSNRMGDLVLHNFLIQQLESWGYNIVLAVSSSFYRRHASFFKEHCLTERVLVLPGSGRGKGWLSFIRQVKKLKVRGVIVDLYPMVNPLAFYLAGVPWIVGPQGENNSFCSGEYRLDKANTHYTQLVNVILRLLEPGITRNNQHGVRPFFPFRPVAATLVGRGGVRSLAIHMGGSGHWDRKWPGGKFELLCRLYLDHYDGQLVFVGGAEEYAACESMKAALESKGGMEGRVINCCSDDLNATAASLSRCDLFLGNDSGPMHIANALNKRVIVIYGPSAYNAVNPRDYDHRNITVKLDLPCMPCLNRECRLPESRKLSCLRDLEVEAIWKQLCASMPSSFKTVIK